MFKLFQYYVMRTNIILFITLSHNTGLLLTHYTFVPCPSPLSGSAQIIIRMNDLFIYLFILYATKGKKKIKIVG